VTLITAYFSVPTIVIYKSSLLNEFIFNHLIKYQGFISLANIILGKRVFFERIQKQASSKQLVQDFKMTIDQKNYNDIISSIIKLPHLLNGELHQVGQFIATDMDQIK
jgi:lipid-A-disaccharide synthase